MNWNDISNEKDLENFLNIYGEFHDCCLKELKYVSGAFVNSDLSMHAINDKRDLYIIFQRQSLENACVELKFSELISLNLCPNDELYTCEILDASFFFEKGNIYWADSNWFKFKRNSYSGTWLCAKRVKWRILDNSIGEKTIY